MASRVQFALALLLDLAGAALVLLVSARSWQTIATARPRPLADAVLHVSGRTLNSATTALGLVALAGVVAVLATRGLARRAVGVVLAAAGVGVIWSSVDGLRRISASRARALLESKLTGLDLYSSIHTSVQGQWAVLSAFGGALVFGAGLLIALAGHRWVAMSPKYDAPGGRPPSSEDVAAAKARAEAGLWSALDSGNDPTAKDTSGRP
jgi:uncharacterized membrane protein (TIGR02234 family)